MGVNRPQQPFTLDGNVVPVVLVDSGVSFVAAPTPPYQVTDIFTNGILTAPAINTILADTGPLPIGPYSVQFTLFAEQEIAMVFEWRDAANAVNLWTQRFGLFTSGVRLPNYDFMTRLTIANAGERFRILMDSAGGVGLDFQASILARI